MSLNSYDESYEAIEYIENILYNMKSILNPAASLSMLARDIYDKINTRKDVTNEIIEGKLDRLIYVILFDGSVDVGYTKEYQRIYNYVYKYVCNLCNNFSSSSVKGNFSQYIDDDQFRRYISFEIIVKALNTTILSSKEQLDSFIYNYLHRDLSKKTSIKSENSTKIKATPKRVKKPISLEVKIIAFIIALLYLYGLLGNMEFETKTPKKEKNTSGKHPYEITIPNNQLIEKEVLRNIYNSNSNEFIVRGGK